MMDRSDNEWVRVEVRADMLRRLVGEGHACAADFRCLDARSKERLWRLCLDSCRTCARFRSGKMPSCATCPNKGCRIRKLLAGFGSGDDKGVC
jgi:hypothetical protein